MTNFTAFKSFKEWLATVT